MQNRSASIVLLVLCSLVPPAFGQRPAIEGFSATHSQQERLLEDRFMTLPDARRAEALHSALTAEPHMAGSAADRHTAEYVLQKFRSYGFDASIEEFQVLLSEPREVKLDLIAPAKFSGPTPELPNADPGSRAAREAIGFNAYSATGEVTGDVVFANRGLPADYEYLRQLGISVAGKIVIVRRGDSESFRGVKVKVAEEHMAAGLIIYSDPDDSGYHAGDTLPKGPWRPPTGVERGTLLYEFYYPGDPTTPQYSSVPGAARVDIEHSNLLPKIPTLPLSYGDATHILENLAGPAAPQSWQGGLPFTYHVGPGPAQVRLRIAMENSLKPIWVVVARIRGATTPDEIVLVGNHRDAWTYGGIDPGTGTVAMLETARSLGELMRSGWRPRRSIWLCSWDAEEQGMIGSTEWAEAHAAELMDKAIAYLNVDVAVAGGDDKFAAAAVPSLKEFMREVAADVPDPRGGSILERARDEQRDEVRSTLTTRNIPPDYPIALEHRIAIDNPGGGTDFVSFLNHLGIASTDFGFGDEYGAYHSIFDTHQYVKQFGDPGFLYQVASARYLGLLTLRLANSDLLPFDYEAYGQEIEAYLARIQRDLLLLGLSDQIDVFGVKQTAKKMAMAAFEFRQKYEGLIDDPSRQADLDRANAILAKAERGFLLPNGLPDRPWYRHAIFAPGVYSADSAMSLPGVQQSLDKQDFEEAKRQLDALNAAMDRVTQQLRSLL